MNLLDEQPPPHGVHFLLGALDAKVDILLAREAENAKRIRWLERKYWIGVGLGLAMLFLVTSPGDKFEIIKRFFI